MSDFNIAVCDDDDKVVKTINKIINNLENDYEVHNFYDPSELFEYLSAHGSASIQIVIMDIHFEDYDGITESNRLLAQYPNLKIILLTGHVEYVHNIINTEPISFIFKPVVPEELKRALERAKHALLSSHRKTITVNIGRNYHNIYIDEIVYIESNLRKSTIHFENSTKTCLRKLSEIEPMLDDSFIRCHQSYLVNMRYISTLENNRIILKNNVVIPISRNKKSCVHDSFLKYFGDVMI